MLDILLSGCGGKMGRAISRCAADRDDCRVVAGIDRTGEGGGDFPVFASPALCQVAGDVIVDFSHPSMTIPLLAFALDRKLPIVVATTGLGNEQTEKIREASRQIPVFFTANMSLGVNLLAGLCKQAAAVLGRDFDIEIVERHHNQKLDAPSGTALMLADTVSSVLEEESQYVYDRHSRRKKREHSEIGIHAVRGGTIVGEHDVIFAGRDEVITLSHAAYSKDVFAVGALNAALFLKGCRPGLYSMADLISMK